MSLTRDSKGRYIPKHGMYKTRFHRIWRQLRSRCNDVNIKGYELYGGRGIKCCKRWDVFENFRDDMYESYTQHCEDYGKRDTTIDRINTDKDYSPSNCRWATMKQQCNNRTNSVKLTYKGATKTLREWSCIVGISTNALKVRYHRGWDSIRILTQPTRNYPITSKM